MCVVRLAGEFDLGRLRPPDQARRGLAVGAQVDARGHLETFGEVLRKMRWFMSVPRELGVAAGGLDHRTRPCRTP